MKNDGIEQLLIKWRRELHQIPELGFELDKTRSYIKQALEDMGYFPEMHWGKSAVILHIEGCLKTHAVAFRADMDALSVAENTGVDFCSIYPGNMHACGHDGHMAALLGLAYAIKQSEEKPAVNVLLIFQPAEEGPGGAEILIKEGLLEHYKVKSIYGIHLFPGIEEGTVGLKPGPFMAQNGEIDIVIKGRSAHGAQPHQGVDSIVAAADLIMRLQTITSRGISPLDPAVLTFGRIDGGERCNIIPGSVKLEGTMRAFKDTVFKTIQKSIIKHAQATDEAYGTETVVTFRDMYPAVTNDPQLVQEISNLTLPFEIEWLEPYMLAEDFAFYQQKVPGVFAFVGTKNEEKHYVHPLHNGQFNFDEKVLKNIVKMYMTILSCQS